MNVLLTNDDGVDSAGLRALAAAMPVGTQAVIAAPHSEKSATSHSISLGQRLRVDESVQSGIPCYAVHGTPADCVKFALSELKHFVPDLIVSGINQGANTGVSVYYSGTISAAREGLINRIPSMAVSLCSKISRDYIPSMEIVQQFVDAYAAEIIPKNVLININVPALPKGEIKGVKITKQAASRFIEEFVPEREHDGRKTYKLAGEIELYEPDGTSDEEAINDGYISVTPLKLDLTDYHTMHFLQDWVNRQPKPE
ncbi:5'-nucleotidase surE (Nucleoside 5'-monophosphate phosphohydrolase) [sediment metagenome]|uniref:5'-nucleotidase surE (Nucleoside 5'-monophosphate phosphohydrolase) n=1 Tax=sediment metagenome TaxID=749907 RepID=D9PHR2_9ZZZZ